MNISGLRTGMRRARRSINDLAQPRAAVDRLTDLAIATGNPGNLRARIYLPTVLKSGAPLVVVLHGCTQSAAIYDHGSGWSHLADRHGFALLLPQQQTANNIHPLFNWYLPGDASRGVGEVESIGQMIATMVEKTDLAPARIFVTGLSAGGAMAS